MKVIQGRNMHEVFPRALNMLLSEGVTRGDVVESYKPVTLILEQPMERLVYGGFEDLNPFESLFYSLWVLGGRNDVVFLNKMFGGHPSRQSDDGVVLHGAYGHRIRSHFYPDEASKHTVDQLKSTIAMLQKEPKRRDVVIELWNTTADLGLQSRNLPSATHIYLSTGHRASLGMMVVYRDVNTYDMLEDSIAFSMMQEFIARALKMSVDRLTLVINHLNCSAVAYEGWGIAQLTTNPYDTAPSSALVFNDSDAWLGELSMFLDEGPVMGMREPFLRRVAAPMWQAWRQYKETTGSDVSGARTALNTVSRVSATDWRAASTEWLTRRIHERTNNKEI